MLDQSHEARTKRAQQRIAQALESVNIYDTDEIADAINIARAILHRVVEDPTTFTVQSIFKLKIQAVLWEQAIHELMNFAMIEYQEQHKE